MALFHSQAKSRGSLPVGLLSMKCHQNDLLLSILELFLLAEEPVERRPQSIPYLGINPNPEDKELQGEILL